MMSKDSINMNVLTNDLDKEILRAAVEAELDLINFYERMAKMPASTKIRKILLGAAKEKKNQAEEFQFLLLNADENYQMFMLEESKNEVEELLKGGMVWPG